MKNPNNIVIKNNKIIIEKNNVIEEMPVTFSLLSSLREILLSKFSPDDLITIYEGISNNEEIFFEIELNSIYISRNSQSSIMKANNYELIKVFDYILDFRINHLIIHLFLNILLYLNQTNFKVVETDFEFNDNKGEIISDSFFNSINNIMNNLDFFDITSLIHFEAISFMNKNSIDIRKLNYKDSQPYIKLFNRLDANSENFENDINLSNKELPIVFISDSNQLAYCFRNIENIISQTTVIPNFYIVLVDITIKKTEKLRKQFSNIIDLKYLRIINVNLENFNINISKLKKITPTANIMLYLPKILNDLDRVLYLDVDTVVFGDISTLNSELKEDLLYVKQTHHSSRWLKKLSSFHLHHANLYSTHNTGVVHFPLKKMRENNFVENAELYYYNNYKKIRWVDQDILDAIWPIKDLKWNLNIARSIWPKHHIWRGRLDSVRIYHFLNKNKQWKKINFLRPKTNKHSLTRQEISGHRMAYYTWNKTEIKNSRLGIKNIFVFANNHLDLDSLFYWENIQQEYFDIVKVTIFISSNIFNQMSKNNYIEKKMFKMMILPVHEFLEKGLDNSENSYRFDIMDRIQLEKIYRFRLNKNKLF